MRYFVNALLISLLCSCGESAHPEAGDTAGQPNSDTVAAALIDSSVYRHQLYYDSLVHLRDSIIDASFRISNEFPDPMYAHKNWDYQCCMVADRIMAFVGIDGTFHMYSCVDGNAGENFHDTMRVQTPLANYNGTVNGHRCKYRDSHYAQDGFTFYEGESTRNAAWFMAQSSHDSVHIQLYNRNKLVARYPIIPLEQEAMNDCVTLSKVLSYLRFTQR